MGTLHFVTAAVAMVIASVFFDGTAVPMAMGIALCAVGALLLTQATIGRRRARLPPPSKRPFAGDVDCRSPEHAPGFVLRCPIRLN